MSGGGGQEVADEHRQRGGTGNEDPERPAGLTRQLSKR